MEFLTNGHRHFGGSTDDVAIFIEDTLDSATVKCMSDSPSAVAILSPQRLPLQHQRHADATDFDCIPSSNYAAGMSSSAKKKFPRRSFACDMTNIAAAQRLFANKSENATPCGKRVATVVDTACSTTPGGLFGCHDVTPAGFVPLAEFEKVERERHRYQKMYEHQKTLYEEMAENQQETYKKLQDKIVEVVALSTRNEESKRFIRQLKKEMLESRTRVLDLHNRQLEESRSDRSTTHRLQNLLDEQEAQFSSVLQQREAKMAGLEGLVRDLTTLKTNTNGKVQIAQLDHLLKASYTKNAALFGDLVKQGRQLEMLFERKMDLEKCIEGLRRDKREAEFNMASERRALHSQHERFGDQIEEQQHIILELRQCLMRTMANGSDSEEEGFLCEDEEEDYISASQVENISAIDRVSEADDGDDTMISEGSMGNLRNNIGAGVLLGVSEGGMNKSRWAPPLPPPPPPALHTGDADGQNSVPLPVRPIRRMRAVPPQDDALGN